jgi:hypothetical protein
MVFGFGIRLDFLLVKVNSLFYFFQTGYLVKERMGFEPDRIDVLTRYSPKKYLFHTALLSCRIFQSDNFNFFKRAKKLQKFLSIALTN